jgi:hypothetical protein
MSRPPCHCEPPSFGGVAIPYLDCFVASLLAMTKMVDIAFLPRHWGKVKQSLILDKF